MKFEVQWPIDIDDCQRFQHFPFDLVIYHQNVSMHWILVKYVVWLNMLIQTNDLDEWISDNFEGWPNELLGEIKSTFLDSFKNFDRSL